ncbi:hypothetical protein FGB62_40g214 [Gracilaria domingensis]|nr:hypothetical protein FGB62_40g214 [Gracilaria domingensis]
MALITASETLRVLVAILFATTLAVRGRRRKSLSPSGAVAAFVVGFLSFAASLRFGLTLLSFYLSATRATKYKSDYKRRIEDGFTAAQGNRNAAQVLASSLPAVVVAVLYVVWFRVDMPVSADEPSASMLLLAFLLFFAACAGDTFASEIGIAMPGPGKLPVLITAPWRNVPRGTNGGVTLEGTLASALGGFIVGLSFFLTGPRQDRSQAMLIAAGIFGGVIGSALDSVVGCVLQASWLDKKEGRVCKERPVLDAQSAGRYQHICGIDVLSGETVNVLSAIMTAGCAPFVLQLFSR